MYHKTEIMSARTFAREERKHPNGEKLALAELVCKMKEEYDTVVKCNEVKTIIHVPIIAAKGFTAKAVCQF